MNNYSVALQIAQDGAGLALGWERLVRPLLRTGLFAPVGPHSLEAPHASYLVSRPAADLTEATRRLRDWIVDGTRRPSD